jgi:hypothetical protein
MRILQSSLFLACWLLVSCNGNGGGGTSEEEKVPAAEQCYASYSGKDTVLLHTRTAGDSIKGTLSYRYYEKDRNEGQIAGILKGDTLVADYSYMSEGVLSVRQVAFLRQGDSWVEGYGEMTDEKGRMVFAGDQSIDYNKGMLLKIVPCK